MRKSHASGFTVVELLVVLAIIGVLLAIGIPAINESREKSRDAKRISDLKRLEFALEVYYEANGDYPDVDDPTVVGEGGEIDALLAPFMGSIPRDPLGSASDSTYEYIYDDDTSCGALIYAKTMERTTSNNSQLVCSDASGYVVALGTSNLLGGPGGSEEEPPPAPPPDPGLDAEKTFGDITFTRSDSGGNAYYISETTEDFNTMEDLLAEIEADGGHIVTISSQEENDFIEETTSSNALLGLVQIQPASDVDTDWEWLNGEPLTYTNWDTGANEPNDYDCSSGATGVEDGDEDYAEMWKSNGKWNDQGCGGSSHLVVEYDDEGASTSGGGPDGYAYCSDENETCSFSGTADVAYGADGSFYYKADVSNSIECTNSVFGDPIVGTFKACYIKQ